MAVLRRAALNGADYFFLALESQARRAGVATALCRVRLELEGDLALERLREAALATGLGGWTNAVVLARRPPFARPHWHAEAGPLSIEERSECSCGLSAGVMAADPPSPRGPERYPLRLELARHAGRSCITLTWHHGRTDARGAELMLRHLNACAGGAPSSAEGLLVDEISGARGPRSFAADLRAARKLAQLMEEVSRPPMLSLTRAPLTPSGRTLYRIIELDAHETKRAEAACAAAGAGFFPSTAYLAAAMMAMQDVRRQRGTAPGACVVHVPHDLRRVGAYGPMLTNALSFFLYRAEPEDFASLGLLVRRLREQMTAQMRQGSLAVFSSAMRAFLHLPLSLYSRLLAGPSGGKVSTFCFSDTGEGVALPSFLGLPVRRITRLAPAPYPPGIQIVAGRGAGQLSFVVSWTEGCLTNEEVNTIEQSLRRALVHTAALESAKDVAS